MTASPDHLVPRIKHLAFEQALVRAGVPEALRPVIEPLCGELVVTYAFNLPGQFVMASRARIDGTSIAPLQVRALAVANLRAAMRRDGLKVQFLQREAPLIEVQSGGDVEACLLLVDDFWSHVQTQFGGPIVVSAPRRDRLLFACAPDARALDVLGQQADAILHASNDPHGLSAQLMQRNGSEWCLVKFIAQDGAEGLAPTAR